MSLPQWCQTHSLKDFFELLEEDFNNNKKGKNMNATNIQMEAAQEELQKLPFTPDAPKLTPEVLTVQTDEDTGAKDEVVDA